MDKEKKILIECDCGSEIISFKSCFYQGNQEIYISSYLADWYTQQKPGWYSLLDRLKIIWNILRGKQYSLYEVVLLDEKEVKDFKQKMKEFIED